MAVVTVNSTEIAGAVSIPPSKGSTAINARRVYEKVATVEIANGDSIGSTFRLVRLASNVRVSALLKYSDAITSAAADFGFYRTAQDGGLVVDADALGSAVSIATADVVGTNIAHESGVYDISEAEQFLWQVLGFSTDPQAEFDLVATLTAAATAAGTLTVVARYTQAN